MYLLPSQAGLIVPSLIFGFLGSNLFSRSVYLDLFGMNSAIFQRKNIVKWRQLFSRVFNLFIFAIGILLLAIQFKVYLKTDGENIYVGKLKGQEKIYAVDDIKKVASNSSHTMEIYMRNGEKLSTKSYSGNLNYFLDNL
ncbi:MAG: hypothetical protein U5L96_10475 [Owenweeksia sp.]|nr:hypothetical protein [Owenweeksia sp.]